MAITNISEKKKAHFFNLDRPTQEPDEDETQSYHHQKTTKISKLVSLYFDCELIDVKFDKSATPRDVFQYFRDAFQSMGDDDVIIIYYEGEAAHCGKSYKW